MRKIGYARVSSSAQNLDRQLGALRAERCHEIFREKASGKAVKGRPELEKAIDDLGKGDILIVAEWDRATRSMMDGVQSSSASTLGGADQGSRQTAPGPDHADRPRLHRLPVGAGRGRAPAHPETGERWRKAARARGARFGRKPKLSEHQQAEALKRLAAGGSCRQIGKSFNVHHATVSRLQS